VLEEGGVQVPAPQRQARLLEHLRSELFVDVQVLKEKFGVSIATIRRDLTELEGRGLLKRTHGGAVVINQVTRNSIASVREITYAAEKRRIAEVAAAMIVEGDAVLLDSGTTSLQVARRLAGNPSLTFVTNGSDTVAALVEGGARNVHVIGGQYVDINRSFSGTMAAEMVRQFNVDKAILSVSSIDMKRRLICTLSPEIGCVQQAMIEIAQTVIVVADHSKFQRTALSAIAPLEDVDYIVTNSETQDHLPPQPEKIRKKLVFA
jgi:DeoR/GlpR family transcriptional regulator of sugar metabolism